MAASGAALPPEVNAGQLMLGDQGASIEAAAIAYDALAAALMAEAGQDGGHHGHRRGERVHRRGRHRDDGHGDSIHRRARGARRMGGAVGGVGGGHPAGVPDGEGGDGSGARLRNQPRSRRPVSWRRTSSGRTPRSSSRSTWSTSTCSGPTTPSNMGGYEGIVTTILTTLGIPPPPAPMTANPAGTAAQAAAIGEAAANGAANARCRTASTRVNQAAGTVGGRPDGGRARSVDGADGAADDEPAWPTAADGRPAAADARPVPADARSVSADGDGHARPAEPGHGRAAARRRSIDKVGQFDQTGDGGDHRCAARGGGGGGAGRPRRRSRSDVQLHQATGSFNAPGPPKLPTGWTPGAAVPEVAASASPATGGGTGGLYGAPGRRRVTAGHTGRDERGREGAADGRTMQLTVGPAPGREDRAEKLVQRPPLRAA